MRLREEREEKVWFCMLYRYTGAVVRDGEERRKRKQER